MALRLFWTHTVVMVAQPCELVTATKVVHLNVVEMGEVHYVHFTTAKKDTHGKPSHAKCWSAEHGHSCTLLMAGGWDGGTITLKNFQIFQEVR